MRFLFTLFACLSIVFSLQAQTQGKNRPDQLNKPYVVLISLDGYRWDYTQRFNPPNISRLVAEGTQAESMIPSFPSKTFPNHYSIVTGMTPERHGLVDNGFYDPARGQHYEIRNREAVGDGTWYGGTPLWVLAEQQGMVSASYFFVGSEADVKGIRPSHWRVYEGTVKNRDRIDQALRWLQWPAEERPHLITLYFSDMDDAGHRYGPNNDEKLREALWQLDADLGHLFEGIRKTGLPVHIVLVSDHGMAEVKSDQLLPIDPLENEDLYEISNNGALVHLYLKDKSRLEQVYQDLKAKEKHYKVYRTAEFPHYHKNKTEARLGDLIILPDFPYYFTRQRSIGLLSKREGGVMGEHGFDPSIRDLHGIFYAWGPLIASGKTIPSFQNIHVYPLVCRLLGLLPAEAIDGDPEVLAPVLK